LIRILIADDHSIWRQGLTLILEKSPEIKVVASCANGIETLSWLRNNQCDAALVDLAMPVMNGIELLKRLREEHPKLPVLILSNYPADQYAVRLFKSGAAGYLNKECAPLDVLSAVRCVIGGKRYISPAVAELLADEVSLPDEKLPHKNLSDREYQVFLLIASGKHLTEIADTLKLSVKTIGTYRSRILEKTQLLNNADMMRYAIENHLI